MCVVKAQAQTQHSENKTNMCDAKEDEPCISFNLLESLMGIKPLVVRVHFVHVVIKWRAEHGAEHH